MVLSDKTSPVSSSEKALPERPKKSKLRRAAAAVYESLLRQAVEEDDDDSDSNDETFEGGELNSSDEENVNGIDDSSNDGGLSFLLKFTCDLRVKHIFMYIMYYRIRIFNNKLC